MDATAETPTWLPFAIVGGFLVFFPLLWCFVIGLLSAMGGWNRLAKLYPAGDKAISGESHRYVTGMVGGVSYRNVLHVHLTSEGFFIEPMILFRFRHPRLFIPWKAITERTPVSVLWWKSVRLTIGLPKVGTITLPAKLIQDQPKRAGF